MNTPFSRLVGRWKETQTATDDNGDGVIEDYEIHKVTPGYNDLLYFKSDYTGNETIVTSGDTSPILTFHCG